LLRVGIAALETDATQDERDRYGRLLAYVVLADGTTLNARMVEDGYAVEYTYERPYRHQSEFRAAEARARDQGLGLWGDNSCGLTLSAREAVQAGAVGAVASRSGGPVLGGVAITSVFFDGAVPRTESDEYAEITNTGATVVDLAGWQLNAGSPGQTFVFPALELQPGQSCRVYTDELHPETCGLSFGRGSAVWNNDGDCGRLYDATGALVSEYCY
jgi:hypothetical protein